MVACLALLAGQVGSQPDAVWRQVSADSIYILLIIGTGRDAFALFRQNLTPRAGFEGAYSVGKSKEGRNAGGAYSLKVEGGAVLGQGQAGGADREELGGTLCGSLSLGDADLSQKFVLGIPIGEAVPS